MATWSKRELVCLHLESHSEISSMSTMPASVTATGIGDAFEVGETAVSRVELLSILTELRKDGLVMRQKRPVAGFDAIPGSDHHHSLLLETRSELPPDDPERIEVIRTVLFYFL